MALVATSVAADEHVEHLRFGHLLGDQFAC
jgi:hypothetical protein